MGGDWGVEGGWGGDLGVGWLPEYLPVDMKENGKRSAVTLEGITLTLTLSRQERVYWTPSQIHALGASASSRGMRMAYWMGRLNDSANNGMMGQRGVVGHFG